MPGLVPTVGLTLGEERVWGFAATAIAGHSFTSDQRILYVNPNMPLATDAGNTGEEPGTPFATIAAALLRTRDNRGDIILVGQNDAWQYGGGSTWQTPIAEEVVVTTEGVSIIGVSPGGMGVPWNPVTAAGAGVCITVHALDVFIAGFSFAGVALGGMGIYVLWDGVTSFGENTVIRNCFFDGDMDVGIGLEFPWNNEISHCHFQECDTAGIWCDPAGSGTAYNRIHHNIFHDVGIGATGAISLQGGDDNHIWANSIYNSAAQGAGAATDEGIDTTGGSSNLVFDNYLSCLLPVPAAGDLDDFCTAAATDSWNGNYCSNGLQVTNPT